MAKLRVYQTIVNGDYVFDFVTDPKDLSSNDKSLIEEFGEPEINFGGQFTTEGIDFTIPDQFVKIISGLPFRKVVTVSATPWDTDTQAKLALYRTTIQTNWSTAITTLRGQSDTFTNEYVTTV